MKHHCRICKKTLDYNLVNLRSSPLSNAYLKASDLARAEVHYPLQVFVCESCFLVQLPEYESPEDIFHDYAYFSSFSDSWLAHAKTYVEQMISQGHVNSNSFVIELASNDGYLLQYFLERDIAVLGIEPADNVAEVARKKGIDTLSEFFGTTLAKQLKEKGQTADLLAANNVLAHVPDINDFVAGVSLVLNPDGVATFEFPHLLELMSQRQFDTIYHEHFSYLSLISLMGLFKAQGLEIFNVEKLPTHGGSLRVYVSHLGAKPIQASVASVLDKEHEFGLHQIESYVAFSKEILSLKYQILDFFTQARKEGKSVVGYGAPAKGNTLINYCGLDSDSIQYVVDRNTHKQGMFLPGSQIPIHAPQEIEATQPDYLVIMPWNLTTEISKQMEVIRSWGGRFVTFIPEVRIF